MPQVIYDVDTGRATLLVDSTIPNAAEDNCGSNETYIEVQELLDLSDVYVVDGTLASRPDLDLPTTKQLATNEDWVVGTLPEGTSVYIDRILVGKTDETELVLSFSLGQTYSVKFEPPFPYKPHEMEVVVNEADT